MKVNTEVQPEPAGENNPSELSYAGIKKYVEDVKSDLEPFAVDAEGLNSKSGEAIEKSNEYSQLLKEMHDDADSFEHNVAIFGEAVSSEHQAHLGEIKEHLKKATQEKGKEKDELAKSSARQEEHRAKREAELEYENQLKEEEKHKMEQERAQLKAEEQELRRNADELEVQAKLQKASAEKQRKEANAKAQEENKLAEKLARQQEDLDEIEEETLKHHNAEKTGKTTQGHSSAREGNQLSNEEVSNLEKASELKEESTEASAFKGLLESMETSDTFKQQAFHLALGWKENVTLALHLSAPDGEIDTTAKVEHKMASKTFKLKSKADVGKPVPVLQGDVRLEDICASKDAELPAGRYVAWATYWSGEDDDYDYHVQPSEPLNSVHFEAMINFKGNTKVVGGKLHWDETSVPAGSWNPVANSMLLFELELKDNGKVVWQHPA